MKIEDYNKLKPFDKVWIMLDNKPSLVIVSKTVLTQSHSKPIVIYVCNNPQFLVGPSNIFNTKVELLQHVFGDIIFTLKDSP